MEGLDGGLEETLSRELGKVSLKTIPCLRAPPGVLACDFGIDLGGELGGDIETKARPTGVCRAEPVLPEKEEELLFVRKPFCAPFSVGSGVTALMVAWRFAETGGLVTPGRYAVLRRFPAEVLRGIANLRGSWAPAPVPVGEADLSSRSRSGGP